MENYEEEWVRHRSEAFLRKWLGGILAENGLGRAGMANQGTAK